MNYLSNRETDNKRLKEQFKEEYQELASLGGNGEEIAISWLKAVQALEKWLTLALKSSWWSTITAMES